MGTQATVQCARMPSAAGALAVHTLAYEMNGTWGADADKFFRFVVECAGTEGTRAAELYHWSAMTFGEHWRRLVAVELGRGRVLCLRRAADRGYGGNSVPSAETAPDSL